MEKKARKKKSGKQIVANVVLLVGVLCVLGGLWMSSGSYLWRAAFDRMGIEYSEELEDPSGSKDTPWMTEAEIRDFSKEKAAQNMILPGAEEEAELEDPANNGPEYLSLVGFCKIPKLGMSKNIYLGSENPQMKYGIGLILGTALPGQVGNCVLPGHRSSLIMEPFRHLDKLKNGDKILLEDQKKRYTYEVFDSFVVEPSETWICDPVKGEKSVVTLLTCTPLGISTQRLIVRGRLMTTDSLKIKNRE